MNPAAQTHLENALQALELAIAYTADEQQQGRPQAAQIKETLEKAAQRIRTVKQLAGERPHSADELSRLVKEAQIEVTWAHLVSLILE